MSPNLEESRADSLQERMSAHVQGCVFVANDRRDRPFSATYSPLPTILRYSDWLWVSASANFRNLHCEQNG